MTSLEGLVSATLSQPVPGAIMAAAHHLMDKLGGDAVLFYGSTLRTGDLTAIQDFYVLRDAPPRRLSLVARWLWPDVSYHEIMVEGVMIRAKVATMPLPTFAEAARGDRIDTTIWTRFSQPARLLIARTPAIAQRLEAAVADSVKTATGFAAALGPAEGKPGDYWSALFRETYGAEFRVEAQGRGESILSSNPGYFDAALLGAWVALGLLPPGSQGADILAPQLATADRRRLLRAWRLRKWAGKPLNIARLVKAAWTFDGAARYALWKIERHSGIKIPLTRWRERHPILAAPGVLFEMWRTARG